MPRKGVRARHFFRHAVFLPALRARLEFELEHPLRIPERVVPSRNALDLSRCQQTQGQRDSGSAMYAATAGCASMNLERELVGCSGTGIVHGKDDVSRVAHIRGWNSHCKFA